jgi:hypothetical protein
VTAALVAVAPPALLPDLVLPPGFDRIGETIKLNLAVAVPAAASPPLSKTDADEIYNSRSLRTLSKADLTPCTRCGLRGHAAGEPGRCLGLTGVGIGQSPWMTGEGQ